MPTEIAFKKHTEETRKALKNFNAIRILKAPDLINFALNMLVTLTVGFNDFMPGFILNPLFQEIPPGVENTINNFCIKNPGVLLPETTHHITGLVARIKDSLIPTAKKGMILIQICLFPFQHSLILTAAIAAANIHPEKIKKVKPAMTKRPRLSKETVNSDDDNIAIFLNAPTHGPSNILPVVPKVTILTWNSVSKENICLFLISFIFSYTKTCEIHCLGSD
ncbi:hypothetical protein BYT27DRAFT_7255038 [Phlegmacium glaucopus]|nr:hypothetical protein BYT27DRAFT_7255038 [Phlegmacium glaucopus]